MSDMDVIYLPSGFTILRPPLRTWALESRTPPEKIEAGLRYAAIRYGQILTPCPPDPASTAAY